MGKFLFSFVVAVLLISLLSLSGCVMPAGQDDKTGVNESTLTQPVNKLMVADSLWGPFYDQSRQVEIIYYLKSVYGTWNTVYATVPDDSVCIGGGAFTDFDGNPGFLTGSWPGTDLKSWYAQSKDHWYYGYHKLTAVAVGLKLKDINGNYIPVGDIQNHFTIYSKVGDANPVSASCEQPINVIAYKNIISGGSLVLDPFNNIGQLLTSTNYWVSTSKAHVYADTKQIANYTTIFDDQYISNFGYLHFDTDWSVNYSQAGSKGCIILNAINGWVLTGIGGETLSYGESSNIYSGRILTSMGFWNYPSGLYGFVKDTDFIYPTEHSLYIYVTQVQKDRRANITPGNYYIRNRWTGDYLYDGYRSDNKISAGSIQQSWNITLVEPMKFMIQNNVTGRNLFYDHLDSTSLGHYEFWRYSTDPNIQNSSDPNGYFAFGESSSGNEYFFHVENQLGYAQTITRRELNPDWWSKDWYLEPAY